MVDVGFSSGKEKRITSQRKVGRKKFNLEKGTNVEPLVIERADSDIHSSCPRSKNEESYMLMAEEEIHTPAPKTYKNRN